MARFASTAAVFVVVLATVTALVQVVATPGAPIGVAEAAPLQSFDRCDEAARWYAEAAMDEVTAWGLGGGPVAAVVTEATELRGFAAEESADSMSAAVPAALASAGEAQGNAAHSATNVQVAGIDEPDLVKTDGEIMLVTAQGRLHVLDVSGEPRALASLDMPDGWATDLLLVGDRAVVLSSGAATPIDTVRVMASPIVAPQPGMTLTLIDLAEPSDPRVIDTITVDGDLVAARLVDGVVRLVVRHAPSLPFLAPASGGPVAEEAALQHNRQVVATATIDDWLPSWRRDDVSGRLVDCTAVHHPDEPAGFGTLSVVSVDPARDLTPFGAAAVAAGGDVVSASARRLYVALQDPDGGGTKIHAFDIVDAQQARYVASGEVPGYLLGQFAMDEHEGHLRVAATSDRTQDMVLPPDPQGTTRAPEPLQTESAVHVLAEQGRDLVEVGRVGGLGAGERIFAVRFLGDLGTVVTFRQTDPLYTLDLADPTAPRLLGELKIPGYSAYLHPLGDDRLLGIGQDATPEGQTTGLQLSLFDLTDLSSPQRVATAGISDAGSEVEMDHRALLWWEPTRTVVLPVQAWGDQDGGPVFTGLVAWRVDADGITEVGRLDAHAGPDGWAPQPRRAVVVRERLLAVTDLGVQSARLADLAEEAWLAF